MSLQADHSDSEALSEEHTPTSFANKLSDDIRAPDTNITEWSAEECARFLAALGSSSAPVTLPGFLVPAWQATASPTAATTALFSTTSKRPSKLGRTPLSIPPGVELSVGEPVANKDLTSYKKVFKKTINIKGPLGSLGLEVPEYVQLTQDPEAKSVLLSVRDNEAKDQKAMWGRFTYSMLLTQLILTIVQELHGLISGTTSWVFQKATQPFSVLLVLVTEPALKSEELKRNFPASVSCASSWVLLILSRRVSLAVSPLRLLHLHVS
jgi:hypothetical protein